MIGSPRTKLVAIMALFVLPIVASTLTYWFFRPTATGNYGELLAPEPITEARFQRPDGAAFAFAELRGKWIVIASDSGACAPACRDKLTLLRQVRLMLGRNAGRVVRVFVADDSHPVDVASMSDFAGTVIVSPPVGMVLPLAAVNDRAHVYLVDPLGNVMMRFPSAAEPRRMMKDLERLLKASQIG
jgi:cytochrome oxidase Cu insertion factor (SCO1/SenC/PrrC family)